MVMHSETCRMVTAKLLTGTARDCDCGVAYDDLETVLADEEAENLKLSAAVAKLVKECDRLREDKERLDYLESEFEQEQQALNDSKALPLALFRRNTLLTRDAIDAHRQALAGGEGE